RCTGRVEVKLQGQWGTVCFYSWDLRDAAVVCRQLGCGSALEAPTDARFGPGSGPIWMSHVECDGSESALSDCTYERQTQYYCNHNWDVGVICSGSLLVELGCGWASMGSPGALAPHRGSLLAAGFVQLAGGDTPCSGRVEINDGKEWRGVCGSAFDLQAANVVCRELECG
ncbi:WC11 protein, partial [Psilopogon haemacephalus]|nr:WC11 protein [Psilopogon haemacephalus]